jgi:hypothetical protein
VWGDDWVTCVMEIVWEAYDLLRQYYDDKGIKFVDESEDEITFALLRYIDQVKDYSPTSFKIVKFHNQPPDKSQPRNRKRNTNDIGVFFESEVEKPVFIFEAKKINRLTESGIKSYLEDLQAFLNGNYGSHLSESALIAYISSAQQDIFFKILEKSLRKKISAFSRISRRFHKISKHKKTGNLSQQKFICHHLVFAFP